MKITKRQLKRIIKEERAKLVKEAGPDNYHSVSSSDKVTIPGDYEQALRGLTETIGEMVLDLLYEELTASGLDLGDREIAMKVAAGLDYAKGQLRY